MLLPIESSADDNIDKVFSLWAKKCCRNAQSFNRQYVRAFEDPKST
jgi:hypothetical protein